MCKMCVSGGARLYVCASQIFIIYARASNSYLFAFASGCLQPLKVGPSRKAESLSCPLTGLFAILMSVYNVTCRWCIAPHIFKRAGAERTQRER